MSLAVEALEHLVALPISNRALGIRGTAAIGATAIGAVKLLARLFDMSVQAAAVYADRIATALRRVLSTQPLNAQLAAAVQELVFGRPPIHVWLEDADPGSDCRLIFACAKAD